MNNKITAFTILAFTLGMVATTTAVTSDTSSENDVTANVTSTIALDVKPESLDYPSLTVGQLEQQSDRGFSGVEIANTGSEYIDQVWLGTSYPDTDPFGTGNPGAYNAGNFMTVKPDNSTSLNILGNDSVYHYVNRVEYEDSNVPSIINLPDSIDGSSVANDHVGQARFGDQWIYWYLPTYNGDICDGSSTGDLNKIRIGTAPSDQNELGSYDFTNSSQFTEYDIADASGTSKYGIVNSSVTFDLANGESDQSYDLLTACPGSTNVDTAQIVLNKYNVAFNTTTDVVSDGSESTYQLDTTTPSDMLQPDQSFTVNTAMNVPRGVSAGQVGAGSLTIYATADTEAQE